MQRNELPYFGVFRVFYLTFAGTCHGRGIHQSRGVFIMPYSGKEYYYQNRDTILKQKSKYRNQVKLDAMQHYGSICACCGETRIEFLSIDHIDGNGSNHKKEVSYGRGGANFYIWLKKNNYPPGFRVLCHNCNQSLGHFGYCPHGNL